MPNIIFMEITIAPIETPIKMPLLAATAGTFITHSTILASSNPVHPIVYDQIKLPTGTLPKISKAATINKTKACGDFILKDLKAVETI